MPSNDLVFATTLYRAALAGRATPRLVAELKTAALVISRDDVAGQRWSKEHGYGGYTSYSSLDDLAWRSPEFADLVQRLDVHVATFARDIDLDLGRQKLVPDNIWINVLEQGGSHTGHIHPNCVVSGTIYLDVPEGAGTIRFEDPRLALMMAAPPRRAKARGHNRTFHEVAPSPGTVLLWESWLRHEVLPSRARRPRISVSFNYRME